MIVIIYVLKEIEARLGVIQSSKYLDCIVHHSQHLMSEEQLQRNVLECPNGGIPLGKTRFNQHLKALVNEGILDRILIPKSDEYYYQLSPIGKQTLKTIIEKNYDLFNHPQIKD